MKIGLSKLNFDGLCTSLESEEGGTITIAAWNCNDDVQEICAFTAEQLRKAAARFELLAKETNPCKSSTQVKINNKKILIK